MKKLLLTLIIVPIKFISLSAALPDSVFQYAGVQSHYGFIIPHSKTIKDISHTKPFGFELNYNRLHTSLNDWKVFNAYWISGIETRYFNYQNPDILGSVFDVSIFAEPVLRYRKKWLWSIRGGAGFSYHSKIYDEVHNPLNFFFSSRIAFPLYVDLRLKRQIAPASFLCLSGCYNHISNGGIKLPNKGMNFPTLALGLEVYQNDIPVLEGKFIPDKEKIRETFLTFQVLNSFKVLDKTEELPEKLAFIYGFHSRISRSLSAFYALNAGAECIFDGYIRETILREQTNIDYKRIALTFGQEFLLGKMIFSQYFGAYLYSPFKSNHFAYQKYELFYKLSQRLLAGVFLKAHLQVAELMGININYKIQLTKH